MALALLNGWHQKHIPTVVPMKNMSSTFPHILALNPDFARPRTHLVRARARSFARLTSELLEQDNTPAGYAEKTSFAILALCIVVLFVASLFSLFS
jgi:hypothetical protein